MEYFNTSQGIALIDNIKALIGTVGTDQIVSLIVGFFAIYCAKELLKGVVSFICVLIGLLALIYCFSPSIFADVYTNIYAVLPKTVQGLLPTTF